jgi:hypothetical protein
LNGTENSGKIIFGDYDDNINDHDNSHFVCMEKTTDNELLFRSAQYKFEGGSIVSEGGFKTLDSNGAVMSGFLKADGTVDTNTYNNYTHPTTAGNKHIPSGGSSGQFLGWASDGTAKWVANPNSDTKVTAVGNHYTPVEDTSAAISAASGTATNITGTGGKLNVVTGLKRDAKGHIVGVTSANIYSTDNNTTYKAGSGLSLSSNTFNIGAGAGITVGDDTISLTASGVTEGTYGDDEDTRALTYSDVFDIP